MTWKETEVLQTFQSRMRLISTFTFRQCSQLQKNKKTEMRRCAGTLSFEILRNSVFIFSIFHKDSGIYEP